MMTHLTCLSLLLLLFACSNEPSATGQDPFADDIPQPVPNTIALAGADEADIVRFLNVQSAIAPSLSPDGKQVAYRTRLSGDFQVWVTRTDQPGIPQQITYGNSVTFHEWSPAGDHILYAVDKAGNERVGFYLISSDGLTEKELLPPSDAYRLFGDFNADGTLFTYATTERNGTEFDIHIYDLDTDTDTKVLEGDIGYYPLSISPDGKYIVISELIGEDANNLYLLEVDGAKLTQVNDEQDPSDLTDIHWTPDSKGFYLITNQGREYAGVAYYSLEDNSLTYKITEDADVEQIQLTDDNILHWVINRQGYSEHNILDLKNDSAIAAPEWPRGIISLRVPDSGNIILANIQSPKIPGDLWAWHPSSDEIMRVTRSNHAGVNLEEMVLPVAHRFQARDGLTIHGLLYAPENLNAETPVVIKVHGGPTSQARPQFDALIQYLVQKGFAVFDLNYRGSTGYGKTYARENNFRKRENELYDLEDAAGYLSEQGIGNAEQIAIMGGSYGGYLTMAALTRLPDVFTCGVAFVGVSNWITALEGTSPVLKASDRLEYGDIDDPEDRKFFESISPINYIEQVKSPIMVLHGANDPRDPVTESDHFVTGIRERGGEVAYLRFPDEGHGIRKMDNRITAYVRVAEFLERHLEKHLE